MYICTSDDRKWNILYLDSTLSRRSVILYLWPPFLHLPPIQICFLHLANRALWLENRISDDPKEVPEIMTIVTVTSWSWFYFLTWAWLRTKFSSPGRLLYFIDRQNGPLVLRLGGLWGMYSPNERNWKILGWNLIMPVFCFVFFFSENYALFFGDLFVKSFELCAIFLSKIYCCNLLSLQMFFSFSFNSKLSIKTENTGKKLFCRK